MHIRFHHQEEWHVYSIPQQLAQCSELEGQLENDVETIAQIMGSGNSPVVVILRHSARVDKQPDCGVLWSDCKVSIATDGNRATNSFKRFLSVACLTGAPV